MLVIGNLPVRDIDTTLVLKVLEPIWRDRNETAARIRARIEKVLDWATARKYREDEKNPARWKGHLATLLPARADVHQVAHFKAMEYSAVPGFMTKLRQQPGIVARALELLVLTAVRSGDIVGDPRNDTPAMQWSHVDLDLDAGVWVVPRVKNTRGSTDREHRVPLSPAAVALLRDVQVQGFHRELVFPDPAVVAKPLGHNRMRELMEVMRSMLCRTHFAPTLRAGRLTAPISRAR